MSPKDGGEDILKVMDDAARELLTSVNPPTMDAAGSGSEAQPIDLKGRIAAFEAVTNYLAVKHKIQPTGTKANGIDGYRSAINGGAPGSRAGRKGAASSAGAARAEADEA